MQDDTNIIDISWASITEKIISETKTINDQVLQNNGKQIDSEYKNKIIKMPINDILQINYIREPLWELIEYQNIVANHIRKSIKNRIESVNNEISKDEIIERMYWLLKINSHFSDTLNLPLIQQKLCTNNIISRSSYKLCEHSSDCEFNYPSKCVKKIRGCYKQHYVFNYLKVDIESIIMYLNNIGINDNINFDELMKCMNTICFVINHMKNEIENLYLKYGKNCVTYICERSLTNKNIRKH